jgi:hypothetical protein
MCQIWVDSEASSRATHNETAPQNATTRNPATSVKRPTKGPARKVIAELIEEIKANCKFDVGPKV